MHVCIYVVYNTAETINHPHQTLPFKLSPFSFLFFPNQKTKKKNLETRADIFDVDDDGAAVWFVALL